MHARDFAGALMGIVVSLASTANAVTVATVPVGNVGNPADDTMAVQQTCCYGSVDYTYRIGTYEVTNTEYAEFLNAVAATDTHELYHTSMGSDVRGGILRSGSSGSHTYSVKPNMDNKPVNYVSFWDAARFANWLDNGQPTGAQNNQTTEEGAYTLGGVTFPDNESVTRNPGAQWFLPSESEWYKAAYYDPRTAAQGGPPGDDNYWRFATQHDTIPTAATASDTGDVSNPGVNVANFHLGADWNSRDGNVTSVGSAGPASSSFYRTFDQAGNVWEWNDAIIRRFLVVDTTFRGSRGGNWDDFYWLLDASWRGVGGIQLCGDVFQCFNANTGFRIAAVFRPEDINGDGQMNVADIDLLTARVIEGDLNTAFDLNADGLVDGDDRLVWVEELAYTYLGDANLDGEFGSRDLVMTFQAGQYEDQVGGNSTWASGDFNGDGEFSSGDLVAAFQGGGYESGPRPSRTVRAAVPEPPGICLMGLALLVFTITRRHRCAIDLPAQD